jgi:hypothetical protein
VSPTARPHPPSPSSRAARRTACARSGRLTTDFGAAVVLAACVASGCAPPVEIYPPYAQVRIPGDVDGDDQAELDLGDLSYLAPDAGVATIEVENVGASVLYVSTSEPTGDGANLVDVDLVPFTDLTPGQRWPIDVRVTPRTWRWATGDYAPTVGLEARFFFSGQAPDEPERPSSSTPPTPSVTVFEVAVTFSLDCDDDNDGHDATDCAGDDCDDRLPGIHPGADEVCNGQDDDCDLAIDDEAVDTLAWFYDGDGDGYGLGTEPILACLPPGARYVNQGDDCEDGNAAVSPGAVEICNGVNDDCDNRVDEGGVCN